MESIQCNLVSDFSPSIIALNDSSNVFIAIANAEVSFEVKRNDQRLSWDEFSKFVNPKCSIERKYNVLGTMEEWQFYFLTEIGNGHYIFNWDQSPDEARISCWVSRHYSARTSIKTAGMCGNWARPLLVPQFFINLFPTEWSRHLRASIEKWYYGRVYNFLHPQSYRDPLEHLRKIIRGFPIIQNKHFTPY